LSGTGVPALIVMVNHRPRRQKQRAIKHFVAIRPSRRPLFALIAGEMHSGECAWSSCNSQAGRTRVVT